MQNGNEIQMVGGIQKVQPGAFSHCDSLKSIIVDDHNKNYNSKPYIL